jgi:predicted nucleotidyltransferase component of viral defense system
VGILFNIDDGVVIGTDPRDLVKDEYKKFFSDDEVVPKLYSEICALDMIYSVTLMREGYYGERLVLKGGMSVRNHVSLIDHRFSFDADYDPNSHAGYSFGSVDEIKVDLSKYATIRKSVTAVSVAKNDDQLLFLELGYREPLREVGYLIEEVPKVEICKRCRILQEPEVNEMSTMMDLNYLGLPPLKIKHVGLEEQLAAKLFIIGDLKRGKRNHFDAYDALRIVDHNPGIDWKLVRQFFASRAEKHAIKGHKVRTSEHVKECRRQLDTIRLNSNKRSQLAYVVFRKDFDFDAMLYRVKTFYDRV